MLGRIRPTAPPPDRYTVISCDSGGQTTSRVVIAGDPADAVETHREHYPDGAVISVVAH